TTTAVAGASLRATVTQYRNPLPRIRSSMLVAQSLLIGNGVPGSDCNNRSRRLASSVTTYAQTVVSNSRCRFFRNRLRIHPRPPLRPNSVLVCASENRTHCTQRILAQADCRTPVPRLQGCSSERLTSPG